MSSPRLKGKTAIVTGSGQGIGAAIARIFAGEGAQVVIATRTESHGQATMSNIVAAGGEAILCVTDVGAPRQIERAVDLAVSKYGKLDIVVHNAASFAAGKVEDLDESQLEESLNVNLKAAFRLSKAAIPHLRRRGGGRLLFTSSVTGPRVAMPGASYYAASKSGLNGFIRTAAIELAKYRITVNGVEPGFIKTPAMNLLADEEGQKVLAKYVPMGALGVPEDIAYAMLYLASEEAAYVTGQTIVVDGGSTLPESPTFADETSGVKSLDQN
ncbi:MULTISPECIES: SDR family oxidoreductase [unclassified Bradyrhizobium]|uniref:SDR family oxidoreductase n=1 Tax=unclassified Bradyrhizobium TaxID=2631580 RepID=UPI001FF8C79E|nr:MULTISPECIES: SDR family oxidoreductase [unclassified Bradyrhizobium]MCK1297396.1 SDR family oxidoreductase [Bradyrhizobium sp. 37]MCK1769124.1 SDR family oxidoreductase [Bradyrhizobium sp. 134]